MTESPLILALETSCDETAVAILDGNATVLASEISSQIDLHKVYGGVVPEVASRNHLIKTRPLIEQALQSAKVSLDAIDAFAATAGPGLAGALLIGNSTAKTLSLAHKRPYLAVNHLEGHLLSPFLGHSRGIQPNLSLIVSGGHTMLIHLKGAGNYHLCGKTRDDAAGEAFDKVGKMLGLPYPGGPEIDKRAGKGNPKAFDFPRSMLGRSDHDFSFSGLKTAVLYTLNDLESSIEEHLADLCASFQEAVVEVLVKKTIRLAKELNQGRIAISGGVSCNSRVREAFTEACAREGFELFMATPALTTDNAAMIAFAALQKHLQGESTPLDHDVDPNMPLVTPA